MIKRRGVYPEARARLERRRREVPLSGTRAGTIREYRVPVPQDNALFATVLPSVSHA
jgi:hypothetical protein